MLGVFFNHSPSSLFCEAGFLTETGAHLIQLNWLASELQGSSCLLLAPAEIIGTCHSTQVCVGVEDQIQVLIFEQQALYSNPL